MSNFYFRKTNILFLSFLFFFPAVAGESMFGYLYTAETIPAGQWEYEQWNTIRSGKARGEYTAFDLRNEIEYGVTDRFQVALYINSGYLNLKNQYDTEDVSMDVPDRNEFSVNGASLEFIYRILSPYKDAFGFAAYLEPELSVTDHMMGSEKIESALEARLIFQKNFLGDELITAMNLMAEPEWERVDNRTATELWFEFTLGASYRVKSNWFTGLEFRNHMEFPEMNLKNQEHSAYFLGPNVHYATENWWVHLTVLPQIAGWPRNLGMGSDGKPIESSYAHLGQHEKIDIRFKFGIPL